MKTWAAALAIGFLIADIIGRAALAATGAYPTNSFEQIFAIVTGTIIVALFAIFIGLKWSSFS